jgi:hypothetical protein
MLPTPTLGVMNKLTIAFVVLSVVTSVAFAQSGTPECSGSSLHLSLATAGSQTVNTAPGSVTGSGVVMFGMSNPATCVTQGVAYITGPTVDSSTYYYYGWALVCVTVPGCTAGTVAAYTTPVSGSIFSPSAKHSAYLAWLSQATIQPGIYGLALGTTCPSTATCTTLYGDVAQGSWYPFVQAGTGTSGNYQWTFTSSGFGSFSNVPPTTSTPALGTGAGPTPPAAILY